jgi:hypothetical protein
MIATVQAWREAADVMGPSDIMRQVSTSERSARPQVETSADPQKAVFTSVAPESIVESVI